VRAIEDLTEAIRWEPGNRRYYLLRDASYEATSNHKWRREQGEAGRESNESVRSREHRLMITVEAGRRLEFAVERLRDGALYHPGDSSWHKPSRGWAAYARMEQSAPGHYEAALPALDSEQDYCVHVVDVDTQHLVTSQLIDGDARKISAPRAGAKKGRPRPGNELQG